MKDQYGNYVVKKAIACTVGKLKSQIIHNVKKNIKKLTDKKLIEKWNSIVQKNVTNILTLNTNSTNIDSDNSNNSPNSFQSMGSPTTSPLSQKSNKSGQGSPGVNVNRMDNFTNYSQNYNNMIGINNNAYLLNTNLNLNNLPQNLGRGNGLGPKPCGIPIFNPQLSPRLVCKKNNNFGANPNPTPPQVFNMGGPNFLVNPPPQNFPMSQNIIPGGLNNFSYFPSSNNIDNNQSNYNQNLRNMYMPNKKK
jgi:hypothetical protein